MVAEIANMAILPESSRVTGYDKKLRMRAMLRDVFVNSQGLYNRKGQEIPNSIYMKVDETANAGANKINVTMKLPLEGSVVSGNDRLLGNEVEPSTKAGTLYRNNYKFAVVTETYNTRELDQRNINLFDQHVKDLGTHAQQFEGLQIREALIQRIPLNMIDSVGGDNDLDGVITQGLNPHVFVQGATDADQPAYDSTLSDFQNNIATSILTVDGALNTQTAAGAATFRMMNDIALRALDKKIMPLDIQGNDAFILTLSPLSATIFGDPSVSNSMGSVWTDYNRLPDKMQNWYGIIGKFASSIGVDIYVVVDHKAPSIEVSGAGAPFTVQPFYVHEGDDDQRYTGNGAIAGTIRDVGILLGKGAIANWEPEKLHMVKHEDDYGRLLGTGYAGTRGIQMLTFDNEVGGITDTSIEYYGSMLCIMNRVY